MILYVSYYNHIFLGNVSKGTKCEWKKRKENVHAVIRKTNLKKFVYCENLLLIHITIQKHELLTLP